ncbi:MerR family transcriptional regulator [Domibacillus sp. A3M-37]|uniref:MerR family transcriptional regulator n=1 Tax=Domibacillus sp. A3M-37 TaxID=2962037 RepID=UPI0020B6B4E6|nr:MerR family transcriptional regulator [Domibacillus sp. A3M-37]MCP3764848.1 MerR family transcriptional regulator [Domibacillus sp. A3M-37]
MDEGNLGYFSKTAAERVGIASETLRGWSLRLEAAGVEFERNKKKQRIYYEKDIRLLAEMKKLIDLQQPQAEVIKSIAENWQKGDYNAPEPVENGDKTHTVSRFENALETPSERLSEFKKELIQELAQTQQEQLDQFKKELALEMAEVMQDRFEKAVNEAVELALLKEKAKIEAAVRQEIEEKLLLEADLTEKNAKKSWFRRVFR